MGASVDTFVDIFVGSSGRADQSFRRKKNLTIVTTSITDRKKFSVNYFLQFLTGLLPGNIPRELN